MSVECPNLFVLPTHLQVAKCLHIVANYTDMESLFLLTLFHYQSNIKKIMSTINETIATLEFAQIGWVVPDIHIAAKFLTNALGIAGFPPPEHVRAQDLNMTYHDQVVAGEWLTTQTYNGGTFIELVQPLSGKSMFHDYLEKYPAGGTQHLAFRLPVSDFERIISELREQGYAVISEVDHPIARMAFFDTYQTLGIVTEIMGITPEGWNAIEQMKKSVMT
jgi:methylmalonyl-CoA/ethylmalonyl-CoA epimerase